MQKNDLTYTVFLVVLFEIFKFVFDGRLDEY